MILITGGKYQGRLKTALKISDYTMDDVFDFAKLNSKEYMEKNVNYTEKKIWYNLQEYVRDLTTYGTESFQLENMIKRLVEKRSPEIIIMAEVGAGVIPMNTQDVLFREATGRLSVYFAEECEEVYRVICGIATKLK